MSMDWADSFLSLGHHLRTGEKQPPRRAAGRIKVNEMMYVRHPAQHPAYSRCLIVVFAYPKSVQTLITNAEAWDGDSRIGLGTTVFTGRQCVHLHSYENLTVIKAAAAAGPAVNAHFDSHCVEIGVSNFM